MLSFETALSSTLVLTAFLMILSTQCQTQNELINFYDSLQLYDYANTMAQSPCDFSKLNTDENFCYSCALSSSKKVYSNPKCAEVLPANKHTIHTPVFTNNKMEKMSISKYALPN